MPPVGDAAAATTTTTTPHSPIRTSPTSAPRVGGYHYEKKNTSSSTGAAPLPSTQQVTSSPRRGSRQEATQVIATIGKNHKSNFSIGAFLGGAPHSTLSGYTAPPPSRQTEPKSSSSSSRSSRTTGGIREQFSGSQGPSTSSNPGVVGSTNRTGVITTTKLKALEASTSDQALLLRNSSSLRLKMPTSLRKIGWNNSMLSNKQQQQQQQPTSESSTSSRLNSLRPFSPFSLRSPILEDERSLTSNSRSKFSLGAMQFERLDTSPYRSPGAPRRSEEGEGVVCTSDSSPSFSTASSQEESLPLTPSTIRSGNFRPRSPVAPELPPSQGSSSNLSFSEFLRDDGVLKTRIRPFPTSTQDDLSLVHTLAEKHTADNRINRRASVSVTSMLSSTSSAPSNHLSSYHTHGTPDAAADHHPRQQHSTSTTITTSALGVSQTGRTDRPPLSPMTFERAPSPDNIDSAELHGHDLPTPRLPPPPASSNTHPPEEEGDNGSAPTPIATLNPEMPFNTFIIPSSLHLHDPTTTTATTHSNPHSRSVSRAGSSELGGSDSRNSLSDTMHPRSGGGGGFSKKKREKVSPAQIALWEEDRDRITRDMMEAYEGEACLIRFEPKQGWIGFWNRGDIDRVIEGLRDLRSPKP